MSSIAVIVVVAIIVVEATTLVLPLLVVTNVDGTGILNATNPVVNVVVVVSDDDFNVPSVSKKGIADVVITTAVDPIILIVDMTMLAKDPGVSIVVKTLGI